LHDNGSYRRTVLDNSVRIVSESIPHVRSLAIGIWFDSGSRDEPGNLSGISHFLEHMNFKGTERRSAVRIAREIEGRGGSLNAFTSKEVTCFFARVVDEQLSRAVDVLSDITLYSTYNQEEIDRERGVILEEMKQIEDTPDDLVFEHFWKEIYPDHPLGAPVIGLRDTLETFDRDKLVDYRAQRYNGSRVVISAAGNLDHKRLVKMIERRFVLDPVDVPERKAPDIPAVKNYREDHHTTTQQAHIIWGCRSFNYADERKYPLFVLNTLLGGGMSSRLFQNIREKHGLAYSVYSFLNTYLDSGLFGVYAGTDPAKAEDTLKLIKKELNKVARKPISDRELNRIKDQLKGSLLLGLESSGSRMHRLAKMEIYTGKHRTLDDVIERINSVTAEDVQNVARKLFKEQASFTTVMLPE